ncbi:MAG: SurA N-terminal domain-containing protein [Bacteroidota bacterium]
MAVLQKIRNRAGVLIIIFVGVALFLFIVDPSTFEGLFNKQETDIAEVDGKDISYVEYQNRIEEVTAFVKEAQQTSSLDEETMNEIRGSVWEELLNEYLLEDALDELGIAVSEDEMENMLYGSDIHPIIRQNFADPQTGQIDTAYVQQFFGQAGQDQRFRVIADYFKKSIRQDRINTKYQNLIRNGFYVPSPLAKKEYQNANKKVAFAYAAKMYKSIPDEDVDLTEDDLKSYYRNHEYMFQNEETTREIEYVSFEVTPSSEDSAKLVKELEDLRKRFTNTDDNRGFVQLHSDNLVRKQYFAPSEIPGKYGEDIFEKDPGFISDIIKTDSTYMIFKYTGSETVPDSVNASHILIRPDSTTTLEEAHGIIDSLHAEIKEGASFAALAQQFSQDGSASSGGDLGWFGPGQMVKPFNDACFYGEEGDISQVETQFGVHLIRIDEQTSKKKQAKLAIVNKDIDYSTDTYQRVYADASRFADKNNTASAFDEAVVEDRLVKKIASNLKKADRRISGLEYSRDIIRWAYNAEEGEVSEVFESGDRFVVAKLNEVREEGLADFEHVKDQIETSVMNKKKAEMLISEMEDAMESNDDLALIADNLGVSIDSARNISFNSFSVPRLGIEPKLIARATNLEQGLIDGPIEGNNGVYLYKVTNIEEAPDRENFSETKTSVKSRLSSRVTNELIEALKEAKEIEDNRSDFF